MIVVIIVYKNEKVKNVSYLFFTFSILIVYPIGPRIFNKLRIDGDDAPHSILAIFLLKHQNIWKINLVLNYFLF